MKIHFILLAAGNSRRFGGNKLLSVFEGKELYRHLSDRLGKIHGGHIGVKIVVSQYPQIRDTLAEQGYLPVRNDRPELGISYSIRLGIEKLRTEGMASDDAVCFFVCDQPYLKQHTVEAFLEAYLHGEKGIACAGHGKRLGNPVIFKERYMEELLTLDGGVGGKKVLKRHMDDTFVFQVKERELEDIDYRRKTVVAVRGGGDLASGTIHRLYREGYRVVALEAERPACIRRQVSFCEAVYDGQTEVEGVTAVRVKDRKEIEAAWTAGKIPVLVDPKGSSLAELKPEVVVDAIIAKRNLGTGKDMAPLTIALGPGFTAGEDVDVVIETMRGESLGRIYREGRALPNTGIPGVVGGYAKERVIHAPADGSFHALRQAGEKVRQGEVIAYVGAAPVYASLTGILRGAIRDGFEVKSGLKIMDIDPRVEERNQCFCISDKAKRIADSVCETIWEWEEAQKPLYERLALDLENHRVVSFVGAGGKTTLIYRLAEELAALGSRVIVTTTTHMEKPQEYFSEWGEELFPDRGTYMTIGVSCEDGKIRGMEREAYQTLREHTDYLFIEADGSRRMPLKVPAAHEPVLWEGTELVVGVLGYNSVGRPICEVAHRAEDVAEFLGKEPEEIVTEADLEHISESSAGLLKGVRVPYRIVWSQWQRTEGGDFIESSNYNRKYIRIQRISGR